MVLPYRTGSLKAAMAAVSTPEERMESTRTFQSRSLAQSTKESKESRLLVWLQLAHQAGVSGPLTRESTEIVVGALLRGGYRSAQAYFSAAKAHHISLYKTWDPELDLLVAPDVTRACKRGQGPPARAAPFPLLTVANIKDTSILDVRPPDLSPDAPSDPWPLAVLSTWALLREIEAANATLADVRKSRADRSFTITAAASKADIAALGVSVTLNCSCQIGIITACPYCVGVKHLEAMIKRYRVTAPSQLAEIPLFPSQRGSWCTKLGVIEVITSLASLADVSAVTRRGSFKWGGHAFRRGGAHMLARLGYSRDQIKAVARHSSSAIDGYLEGADLAYLRNLAPQPQASRIEVTPLTVPEVCPSWTRIRMARGDKVHVGFHPGRAACGWPWAASVSRCVDAGESEISCGRCLRSLRPQASPSPRTCPSSSSPSSASDASS